MARGKQGASTWVKVLFVVVSMCVGLVIGMMFVKLGVLDALEGLSPFTLMLYFALAVATVIALIMLHVAAHEAGHLVFGLLTGYTFVSYRVGSLMLVKQGERIVFKRFSLAGTGGQCIMAPPGELGDPIPTTLYNMGGTIFNLLLSGLFLLVGMLVPSSVPLKVIVAFGVMIGLYLTLTNGVPINTGDITNDGWNALDLLRSEEARDAFWVTLKAGALQYEGWRLRDLPAEWFEFPSKESLADGLVATRGFLAENRLMELHDFEGAKALITALMGEGAATPGLYRVILLCDRVYCDLLREGSAADVSALDDEQAPPLFKQMGNLPSILRARYAVALLKYGDVQEAERLRMQFDDMAKSYPSASEIEAERELMDLARGAAR